MDEPDRILGGTAISSSLDRALPSLRHCVVAFLNLAKFFSFSAFSVSPLPVLPHCSEEAEWRCVIVHCLASSQRSMPSPRKGTTSFPSTETERAVQGSPHNACIRLVERLGESGATHDSQSASRSGVEAWVARNLNGPGGTTPMPDSARAESGTQPGLSPVPERTTHLHHSRLSTRSSYQLYSFSGDRRFCYDNHGSFVYDSPNLFCGPSGSVRTGLTGVRSEPGHRTHLTSLILQLTSLRQNYYHGSLPNFLLLQILFSFSSDKDRRTDSRIRRKKHSAAPPGIFVVVSSFFRLIRLSVLLSLSELKEKRI